jgi:nitrite reductase (NO-forming)
MRFVKALMACTLAVGFGVAFSTLTRPSSAGPLPVIQAQLAAAPQAPPPITRAPAKVIITLETQERKGLLAEGVEYDFWTFGGSVPGPMIRVREGDTVELHVKNDKTSKFTHSIDLHAVNGPGGGSEVTQTAPGKETVLQWRALNPGLYVYHCASPHIPTHIANGMYGLILVEPAGGLSRVNREFYVMQGEFYTRGARGEKGFQLFDSGKAYAERPEYVVLNGHVGALTGRGALQAKVGETVRIFYGNGGPNLVSSFHIIGEIFDRVYPEAAVGSGPMSNVQTTHIPSGGAAIVELRLNAPGTYLLVDHSIFRIDKGAVGQLVATGPAAPDVYKAVGK